MNMNMNKKIVLLGSAAMLALQKTTNLLSLAKCGYFEIFGLLREINFTFILYTKKVAFMDFFSKLRDTFISI